MKKFPIGKGIFITVGILTFSFACGYAAHEIAVHKAEKARVETFKNTGIEVTFEDRSVFIRPIIMEKFAEEVEVKLAVPLQMKQSAKIVFEKGRHRTEPEKPGLFLNRKALIDDLSGRIRTSSTIPLVAKITVETPDILEADLKPLLPELMKKYNTLYTFKSKDHTIGLRLRDQLQVMEYQQNTETPGVITATIHKERFAEYAKRELETKVNQEPTTVKIAHVAGEKGPKATFDGKGKNGFMLNKDELYGRFVQAWSAGKTLVELPIDEKPFGLEVAPELQALGIQEVVSIGHTSYYGSPKNRMYNISVGVEKFNGIIVPPTEIFSFNTHLGPVDGQHGFLKELVIKPEGTIPEFGGGLCQVSTTVYRAALYGGLPIVERSPHSYAVSYYSQIGGHGIDATIYPGVHDLRFKNDTAGHLLMQAYTEGPEAYFILYGTKDARKVVLEGPSISNRNSLSGVALVETDTLVPGVKKQVEKAHVGFSTVWYRYVTPAAGGEPIKETIASKYKATQEKYLVGIGKGEEAPVVSGEKSFQD